MSKRGFQRSIPVINDPWKSALSSLGCMPDALGIAFVAIAAVASCDGFWWSPSSSDIYPIHSRCSGRNRLNLHAVRMIFSKSCRVVYFAWRSSNFQTPFSLASLFPIIPSFFRSFSFLRFARFSSSSFFALLSLAGFSRRIWRPFTRVLYIPAGSDDNDKLDMT